MPLILWEGRATRYRKLRPLTHFVGMVMFLSPASFEKMEGRPFSKSAHAASFRITWVYKRRVFLTFCATRASDNVLSNKPSNRSLSTFEKAEIAKEILFWGSHKKFPENHTEIEDTVCSPHHWVLRRMAAPIKCFRFLVACLWYRRVWFVTAWCVLLVLLLIVFLLTYSI